MYSHHLHILSSFDYFTFCSCRNKKNDPQNKIDSHLGSTSCDSDGFTLNQKKEKASCSVELDDESKCSERQISWVAQVDQGHDVLSSKKGKRELRLHNSKGEDEKSTNSAKLAEENEQTRDQTTCVKQLDEKHDTQGVFSPKEETQEGDRSIAVKGADESENEACSSTVACNFSSSISVEKGNVKAASDKEDKALMPINILETIIKDKGSNSSVFGTKSKRRRSNSESVSDDSDSIPSLHSRLTKKLKTSLTKQRSVPVSESGNNRKQESSLDSVHVAEDNDFETPKVRRNVEKRKGSDLSDDQELCSSKHSQVVMSFDVKEDLCSKKKTSQATVAVQTSKKKSRKPVKRKIKKRPLKTASKMACDILEGKQC